MNRTTLSNAFLAACLVAAPLLLPACSSAAEADNSTPEASGAVSMPLVATANGHSYRLRNASINIYGPTYAFLASSDDPDEKILTATLQTGAYTAYLYNWTLERDDGSGQFRAVRATLASDPFVPFSVYNGATTTISYAFETDGVIVTVGSGDLRIKVDVHENAPACTPFGTDCPPGTWCAPTGLTGAALACVPAGAVAVGEPCASPVACVANASCYDLGDGSVCVELCPSSQFDMTCSLGGECQRAGLDYGVCRPGPEVDPQP